MTWEPFVRMTPIPLTDEQVTDMARAGDVPLDVFKTFLLERYANDEIWANNIYQVVVRRDAELMAGPHDWPPITHLSIKRLDREPIHDWRDLQRIKNELVGPENEGVELYPAESRLVDSSNQYHLWVMQSDKAMFPFGYTKRLVFDEGVGGAKQRKRDMT